MKDKETEAKRLLAPMFFPFDDCASLVFCPFSTYLFFFFLALKCFTFVKILEILMYIDKNEVVVMLTWQVMDLSTKQLTKI